LTHYNAVNKINPQQWCLAFKGVDETLEEAVLNVQGIVWHKDLPPSSKER
jgi:hypothetical protein